ncbi:MAG: MBL fold metallo-hydrolase [Candidatus Thorarchaeota archaeon]
MKLRTASSNASSLLSIWLNMKVEKIGSRGLLFPFKDPFLTNVYVIFGNERVYVLDTFLGIDSMVTVKKEIRERGFGDLPVVVFNSHGDYDHYWGNAAFEDALIIGHELCRTRVLREHEQAIQANEEQKKGEVILKAPSLVFSERLSFPNDEVTFFHTPGHTVDSSSCLDARDRVLFVGDNVETPLPYVYNTNIAQFYHTIKSYHDIDWDVMIASHAFPQLDTTLLDRNIKYLDDFQNWRVDLSSLTNGELHLHIHNIRYYEEAIPESETTPEMKKHFLDVKRKQS